jgi:ketosteroid isomerase-like protein
VEALACKAWRCGADRGGERDDGIRVSRRNLEIVASMYDAFARADFESSLACLDPEIEFSQPAEEPGAGTFHGHEGVVRAFAEWTGAWDDYRVDVEELIDLGDQILAKTRHFGRGKSSGAEVELEMFQLWMFRDAKIVRATMYYDEGEALRAAGRGNCGVAPTEAARDT